MSSELAMEFGEDNGEDYAKVLSDWEERLSGLTPAQITPELEKEWSSDLIKILGAAAATTIAANAAKDWASVGLPSADTIKRFARIAVKSGLAATVSADLLRRYRTRVNDRNNEFTEDVSESKLRAPQTVAQIFDMVKDAFNGLMERFNRREGNLTGRRRWRTVGAGSRHKRLEGQIKSEGETFSFGGRNIYGPRPPMGSAPNWSNCSCYLEFEKTDGSWVRMGGR